MSTCRWWNAAAEGALLHARSLGCAGVDVLLSGEPGTPLLEHAREAGMGTVPLRLSGASFPLGLAGLKRLAARFEPDFICAHRSEDHLAAVIAAGRARVVRVRSDIRRPSGSRISDQVDSRTSLVVFSSPFMLREGYAQGRERPVAVLPQAVDTRRFTPADGSSRDPFTLVMAARLSEVKGHLTAIRALRHAPSARLLVVGGEAQLSFADISGMAEAGGAADRVEIAGFVEDVGAAYSRACMGLVPSLASEAVSRAALEMMSSGLPVLAAATNGLVDTVLDGRTGLLHPPGDSAVLGRQIAYLLDNPEVVRSLSDRARTRCLELYSLESVGARWRSLLEEPGAWNGTGGFLNGYHGWSELSPLEEKR